MKRVLAVAVIAAACGSQNTYNLPGSNLTAPSSVQFGGDGRPAPAVAPPAPTGVPEAPPAGFRNRDTQVWLVPAPAGDLQKLAQQPELWPRTQKRVDVVSLYFLHAYHHEGFVCGDPCGPNTYPNLVKAVPEGMFKWLSDRFVLSFEAGSVKEFSCTAETLEPVILYTNVAIANIKKAGGRLSYISLDEPFTAGTANEDRSPFGQPNWGCNLTPEQVAVLQKQFNDGIHARHPEVQIGLIEPYPHFTPDEIMTNILALEAAGITLPYFHLDFDQPRAAREDKDWRSDIARIREFCRAKGIPFGVILVGWDGRTNEQYAAGYWGVARTTLQSVGVTEHTVLQSWAEDPPGQLNSLKHIPDTVPETSDVTHTGLLLRTLEFLGIAPAMP